MLTWHFKKDKPKGERLSEIVKNWPQRPCLRSTKGYIKITKTPKCSKGCALHQLCSFHKFGGATKQYLHLSVILFFFFVHSAENVSLNEAKICRVPPHNIPVAIIVRVFSTWKRSGLFLFENRKHQRGTLSWPIAFAWDCVCIWIIRSLKVLVLEMWRVNAARWNFHSRVASAWMATEHASSPTWGSTYTISRVVDG